MITLEVALETVNKYVSEMPAENIEFDKSLNRILAKDIFADNDFPAFNKSAMDGFALKFEDLNKELEIIETIPAGKLPKEVVEHGKCSKIMTGAPVPLGADLVVMIEDVEFVNNKIKVMNHSAKSNICYKGEDIRRGNKILSKGSRIKSQHIAVLAMTGNVNPLVYQKPKVTVIVSGDEIVEPTAIPGESQIRNSNAYQLMGQIISSGSIFNYFGIVKDNMEMLAKAIENNIELSDVLIITGGVSKGDYDIVKPVLKHLGFQIHFDSVSIQPGKPVIFATRNGKIIFSLSGNPVSSFFQFELLVKPFLLKTSGLRQIQNNINVLFCGSVKRDKCDREQFIPVNFTENLKVQPVKFHGSAHIHALTQADAIASIKPGINELNNGDIVNVRLI